MRLLIINIILTLLLVLITLSIDTRIENNLAYFFIVSVGILHGANDISLISHITKNENSKLKYMLFYIGVVLFTTLIFIKIPAFALLFFVVMSCYHFGEQHFHHKISSSSFISKTTYVGYGVLIFGLVFYFNHTYTISIIEELTDMTLNKNLFLYLIMIGGFSTILSLTINKKNLLKNFKWYEEVLLIVIFAFTFKVVSLIWAFAIYFVLWHSIPSLKDQIEQLHGYVNKKSLVLYLKGSFFNWLVSVIGLIALYYLSDYLGIRFITLFFAFLAAITIPHVIVMYFLNEKKE